MKPTPLPPVPRQIRYPDYTTRKGCLVERMRIFMPNGQVHEFVTLSGGRLERIKP